MEFIIKSKESSSPKVTLSLRQEFDRVVLEAECNGSFKSLMVFQDGKYCLCLSAELDGLATDENGRMIEAKAE